jgi:hypothetical protein
MSTNEAVERFERELESSMDHGPYVYSHEGVVAALREALSTRPPSTNEVVERVARAIWTAPITGQPEGEERRPWPPRNSDAMIETMAQARAAIEALSTRPLQVPELEAAYREGWSNGWFRGDVGTPTNRVKDDWEASGSREIALSMQKAAPAAPSEPWQPSEAQIKAMANRFLCWPLPEHFTPDAGISFKPEFNVEHMAARGKPPMRHKPVGTNLFNAEQAEVMVRFMVEALAPPQKASNQ